MDSWEGSSGAGSAPTSLSLTLAGEALGSDPAPVRPGQGPGRSSLSWGTPTPTPSITRQNSRQNARYVPPPMPDAPMLHDLDVGSDHDADAACALRPPMVRHQGISDTLSPAIYRDLSAVGIGNGVPFAQLTASYEDEYSDFHDEPTWRSIDLAGGLRGPCLSGSSFASHDHHFHTGGPPLASEFDLSLYGDEQHMPPQKSVGDPFGGVSRSLSLPFDEDEEPESPLYRSVHLHPHFHPHPHAHMTLHAASTRARPTKDTETSSFEWENLPYDELWRLLHMLAPLQLLTAMRVCTTWRACAVAIYRAHCPLIPAQPDALLHAIASAQPGSTLLLQRGVHEMSREVCVDKPLRLVSAADESSREGAGHKAAAMGEQQGGGGGEQAGRPLQPVVTGRHHMLLRLRAPVAIEGLTLLAMGRSVGYPNAVVSVEAGAAVIEGCRIACGGADVAENLGSFALPSGTPNPSASASTSNQAHEGHGAIPTFRSLRSPTPSAFSPYRSLGSCVSASSSPYPSLLSHPSKGVGTAAAVGSPRDHSPPLSVGDPWPPHLGPEGELPGFAVLRPGVADAPLPQDPKTGVWVGAAGEATLRRCVISCCMGPGIKIYKGCLRAEGNIVAFSRCGGNVVANGGRITLLGNSICGASGDGVVSWSNAQLHVEGNRIYSNSGVGVSIKASGGNVTVANNCVHDNEISEVVLANRSRANMSGNYKPDMSPVDALEAR